MRPLTRRLFFGLAVAAPAAVAGAITAPKVVAGIDGGATDGLIAVRRER